MADFRRCIPVLALLTLMLGSVVAASAQAPPPLVCNSTPSVPTNIRLEGEAELAGDIVVTCTGGVATPAGALVPNVVNIQVILNTPVTSRLLDTTNLRTEALLLIDEPQPGHQTVCGPDGSNAAVLAINGTSCAGTVTAGGNGNSYTGTATQPNIFFGYLPPVGTTNATNSLQWLGIPIDPPGTTGTITLRFTNIRVSAINLAPGTPVFASFSATPSTSLPLPPVQDVIGIPQKGLTPATITGGGTFQQCATITNGSAVTVSFGEGFPSAFRIREIEGGLPNPTGVNGLDGTLGVQDLPGLFYGSESGFVANIPGLGDVDGSPGLADFGTRIRIVFNNVASGVTFTVPSVITSGTLTLVQVPDESSINDALTNAVATANGTASGEVVYEVTQSNITQYETAAIAVTVSFVGNPAANSPPLGSVTASVSFAPVCTTAACTTSETGPIPRFTDTSVPTNIFSVVQCASHLLFPFVTNQNGFDTGMAISNTSAEPATYANSSVISQSGNCTLNFFGNVNTTGVAPAAQTIGPVAPGTSSTFLVSTMATGFQGYVIADCEFQYGHGFAFISDMGASKLAMGYLALIIPDPPRSPSGAASPFNCGPGSTPSSCNLGSGEQLVQ